MKRKLIIFLKRPEKGRVKTRLAAALGEEEAVRVYKRLAEDTVNAVRPLAGKSADVVIAFDPPEREAEIKEWIRGPFRCVSQGEGDLGERLSRAACAAFAEGAEKAVLIGSDCPELDALTVNRAFRALSKKEVVIGPSKDGGYYLIGLTRARHAFLFDDIPWSTPEVLKTTLKKANDRGISCGLLPEKSDVDTLEDLESFERVSVIIPALDEEQSIGPALVDLAERHRPDEVIVVDGGSRDRTVEIASRYARVLNAEKGRAFQMNAGAAAASGDILLFLHADTRLPPAALLKIREALREGRKHSGRFRMSFGHPHPLLRFYAFQTRFHFFSYGDQGFFVRKVLFQKMGGFDEEAPLEDVDFYRRLLKIETPVIIRDPVITSPRRFLQNGVVKQKLINAALAAMVYAGFGKEALRGFQRAWYKDVRTPCGTA
ncbi:MAG: TIGR04283 family arsenosugar biosynthesis glycosyltransferase [Candidatus Omnitrophica bacterium]|nr:TIGR04283 family arsenosugar biosynthesis glycosyltransferase [Candidatus Omnitrophota bacterium]